MFITYLLSLFSGLFYGITESINKHITETRYSPFSYAFLQYLLNFLIFFVPALFFLQLSPLNIAYLFMLISVIITFASNAMTIKAYKTEDISAMSILSSVSLVTTVLLGVVVLSERLNLPKVAGIIFIIVGITMIFYEGKRLTASKGLLITLAAKILWGFQPLFDKKALVSFNVVTYSAVTMGILAAIHLFIPLVQKEARLIFNKYTAKIILSRISVTAGAFIYFWSIKRGNISIVNTNVDTLFLLSSVLIGIIFLKEKKNMVKKLSGSFLCTVGIILLNFF